MIQTFQFEKQSVKNISIGEIEKTTTTLVYCTDPNEEELKSIASLVNIQIDEMKVYMEDIVQDARPRVIEEEALVVIFKAPFHKDREDIVTAPLAVIMYENKIVLLAKEKINAIEHFIAGVKGGKLSFLNKKSPGYFLYYIIDKVNDEFLYIINKIDDKSELLKEKSSDLTKTEIEKIDKINTILIHFNRALLGNAEVLTLLRKGYHKALRRHEKQYFNELYFDVMQLIDTEKIQRDVITGFFNFQSALSSHRLNERIKRITSLALIIMVPTLITGMYGMNLQHIPFADNPYGFYIINSLMFIVVFILLWLFNKFEWI